MPRTGPLMGEDGCLHLKWAIRADNPELWIFIFPWETRGRAGVALFAFTPSDQLGENLFPVATSLCSVNLKLPMKEILSRKGKPSIEL